MKYLALLCVLCLSASTADFVVAPELAGLHTVSLTVTVDQACREAASEAHIQQIVAGRMPPGMVIIPLQPAIVHIDVLGVWATTKNGALAFLSYTVRCVVFETVQLTRRENPPGILWAATYNDYIVGGSPLGSASENIDQAVKKLMRRFEDSRLMAGN